MCRPSLHVYLFMSKMRNKIYCVTFKRNATVNRTLYSVHMHLIKVQSTKIIRRAMMTSHFFVTMQYLRKRSYMKEHSMQFCQIKITIIHSHPVLVHWLWALYLPMYNRPKNMACWRWRDVDVNFFVAILPKRSYKKKRNTQFCFHPLCIYNHCHSRQQLSSDVQFAMEDEQKIRVTYLRARVPFISRQTKGR